MPEAARNILMKQAFGSGFGEATFTTPPEMFSLSDNQLNRTDEVLLVNPRYILRARTVPSAG